MAAADDTGTSLYHDPGPQNYPAPLSRTGDPIQHNPK